MRMSRRMGINVMAGMNPDSVTVNGGGYLNYITTQASDYDNLHQPLPGWTGSSNDVGWYAYLGVNGGGIPHALLVHFKTGDFEGTARNILVKIGLTGSGGYALPCGWAICSTDANGCAVNHKKYIGHIGSTPPSDDTIICSGTANVPYNSGNTLHSFSGKGKFAPETWYCIYIWPSESTKNTLNYMKKSDSSEYLVNTVSQ